MTEKQREWSIRIQNWFLTAALLYGIWWMLMS